MKDSNEKSGSPTNSERNDQLVQKIIRKLLMKRVLENRPEDIDVVLNWFPKSERGEVKRTLVAMADDSSIPIKILGSIKQGSVYIKDYEAAIEYSESMGIDTYWL